MVVLCPLTNNVSHEAQHLGPCLASLGCHGFDVMEVMQALYATHQTGTLQREERL